MPAPGTGGRRVAPHHPQGRTGWWVPGSEGRFFMKVPSGWFNRIALAAFVVSLALASGAFKKWA